MIIKTSDFYNPTKKQKQFHDTQKNRDLTEVLYGGAAGGGKSLALIMDVFKFAMLYPNANLLLLRRTLPELNSSIIQKALSFIPKQLFSYNSSEHTMKFINNSHLYFGYLNTEMDKYRYQGGEYSYIGIDELTHFEEASYLFLMSRLRNSNGYPNIMRCTANPIPYSKWVKNRFIIEPTKHAIYIPATVYDNPYIDTEDYVKKLSLLPDVEKEALLNGNWDIQIGKVFKRNLFITKNPPENQELFIYIAVDLAFKVGDSADKTAIIVLGQDENNTLYILDLEAGQYDFYTAQQLILSKIKKWKPFEVGIEKTSGSWHFVESFKEQLIDSNMYIPFVELMPSGRAKNVRIESFLLTALKRDNLFLSTNSDFEELIIEAINFDSSKKSNKDDILDALSYAVEMSYKHYRKIERIDTSKKTIGSHNSFSW